MAVSYFLSETSSFRWDGGSFIGTSTGPKSNLRMGLRRSTVQILFVDRFYCLYNEQNFVKTSIVIAKVVNKHDSFPLVVPNTTT